MEKLWERLEASILILDCVWRIRECENSYAAERAYAILEEFLESDCGESLEEVRNIAERIDEVLKECECHEVQ